MAVGAGPLWRAAGPPIGAPRRSGARPEPGLRPVAGGALFGGRSPAAGPDRVATAPAEAGSGRSCCSLVRDASPTSQQPAQRSALYPRGQVRARGDPAIALWELDMPFDPSPGSATCSRAVAAGSPSEVRSEEHTSELQSQSNLVCRLLLDK